MRAKKPVKEFGLYVLMKSKDVDVLLDYQNVILSKLSKADLTYFDGNDIGPFPKNKKMVSMKLFFYPKTEARTQRLASKIETIMEKHDIPGVVSTKVLAFNR